MEESRPVDFDGVSRGLVSCQTEQWRVLSLVEYPDRPIIVFLFDIKSNDEGH